MQLVVFCFIYQPGFQLFIAFHISKTMLKNFSLKLKVDLMDIYSLSHINFLEDHNRQTSVDMLETKHVKMRWLAAVNVGEKYPFSQLSFSATCSICTIPTPSIRLSFLTLLNTIFEISNYWFCNRHKTGLFDCRRVECMLLLSQGQLFSKYNHQLKICSPHSLQNGQIVPP